MGTDGWDDDAWRRGGAARNRRANGDGSPDRSYGRGLRESARSADGWEPPRNSRNDASGQGSRYGRRSPQGGDDWGDSGGRGGSGYGGRGRPGGAGGAGSSRGGSRAPREDYEDDYRSRGRGPAPADRAARNRAAPRQDSWDAPQQRGRRPAAQGGLWEDDARPRRQRPGGSDPSGRMPGRYDPRDPRSRRPAQAAAKKSGGISFGTSFGVIVLMFLIGAAAAFGVFSLTKPTAKADTTVPGVTPTVPSTASPSVSPTAPKATPTKSGSTSGHEVFVLVSAFPTL